ncbi:uncharacterized protein LOC110865014 [Helianthus annuus]|uniref:uncharacterized protein LOC110865014 n=1 Tax=Helianthus annuus TaxID=4232 RepID=UPI0016533983|nr:uncharacterized protein LOC110865014 [Helianthus annuus]
MFWSLLRRSNSEGKESMVLKKVDSPKQKRNLGELPECLSIIGYLRIIGIYSEYGMLLHVSLLYLTIYSTNGKNSGGILQGSWVGLLTRVQAFPFLHGVERYAYREREIDREDGITNGEVNLQTLIDLKKKLSGLYDF